jgi:hypothetical protein
MHRFRAMLGDPEGGIAVEIVQLQDGWPLRDTLEEIYASDDNLRLGTEALILRLPVDRSWPRAWFDHPAPFAFGESLTSLLGDFSPEETFARFEDRPMYFLTSEDGVLFITGNINPAFQGDLLASQELDQGEVLDHIRQAEFRSMLNRSRAIISSSPGTVFEAPSKRLVRHFVRVGNIQYDRDAIDAVFYWLLPHLKRCAAILTDTWSISSIAFNAARLTRSYFGGPTRRVELLPDYIGALDGSEDRARSIVERLVRESPTDKDLDRVICLISATQSGSLRERLDATLQGRMNRFTRDHIAIIGLGDPGMPVLYDLSDDARFGLIDEDDAEALQDRQIQIDPQVYFPLIFEDIDVTISGPLARKSRGDWNLLAAHGVVQVHREVVGTDKPRHHGVHLATEKLLAIQGYTDLFDAALAAIDSSPILIVAPLGEAPSMLAQRVYDTLSARGQAARLFLHDTLVLGGPEGLNEEEQEIRSLLAGATDADEIIILTDAWVNDASLTQFQKSLRNENYRGRIRYIVGIARPESLAEWAHTSSRLASRPQQPSHIVTAIMTVPVPDWAQDQCPWCEEVRLYERWSQRSPLPPFLSARRDALSKVSRSGLEGDVLLGLPHLERMRLGPDSFYVQENSSEAEAFAAVASVLQRLRNRPESDGPALGPKRFPVSTVLKPTDYTRETWSDAILRGMFLRAAMREELVYTDPAKEKNRTKAIHKLVTNRSHLEHAVLLEVLLAAALRKISLAIDKELRDALTGICGGNEESRTVVSYMLDQIELDQEKRTERALRSAPPPPTDEDNAK